MCFSSRLHRCIVPECDVVAYNGSVQFDQPWLSRAIPLTNTSIENCLRFKVNQSVPVENDQCLESYFDRTVMRKCDDFVFKTDERSIQNEVSSHFYYFSVLYFDNERSL